MALAITLLLALIVSVVVDLSPFFLDDRSFSILYVGGESNASDSQDEEEEDEEEPDSQDSQDAQDEQDVTNNNVLTDVPMAGSELDNLDDLEDLGDWDAANLADELVEFIKEEWEDD